MKRTAFLVVALFALMAVGLYAQTEADFDVTKSADGKSITIIKYKGTAMAVNIPAKIQNLPVTEIADKTFGASKITSVVIPDSVTRIGFQAFYRCSNLTSVTIGNGVINIGQQAFLECTSLTSITIPNSVTSISDMTFANCKSLTSVTIGSGVGAIGKNAFSGCTNLTSVTFLNSTISSNVFDGLAFGIGNLREVYLSRNGGAGTYTTSDRKTWTKQGASTASPAAAGTPVTEADFEVTKSADGKSITITKYKGTAKVVKIPEKIQNLPVTRIGNAAFENDENITSVTIPNGVISIGNDAFLGCDSLASITIPNSVTSIGVNAFLGCTSLASITIPNSVTSIGNTAFLGCTSLASITIPNSVTSIGSAAFSDCTSLTSITIPNSVTFIRNQVFSNCTGLTSVTIPNSVKTIDQNAFESCTSLTSITIPDSVTSIGSAAFSGCTSLASVTIPNGVKSIEKQTFLNCTKLTSITIPASVTSIGNTAFRGCTSLTSVTFAGSIQSSSFQADAFTGLGDIRDKYLAAGGGTYSRPSGGPTWTKIASAAGTRATGTEGDFSIFTSSDGKSITITKYKGTAKDVKIPEKIQNLPVIRIDGHAFEENENMTSVTIPNGVTSIGISAFDNCTKLTSVTIPNSVTSIEVAAFRGCDSLASITIPNSLTKIDGLTFANCTSLTSVTIPNGVKSIGGQAFYYCTGLASITIPNSVIKIEDQAFNNCTNLASITIPNSVTSIERLAFQSCKKLTSITIPASVTSIGNIAFSNCTGLTSITFAGSIPSSNFQADAFRGVGDIRDKYLAAGGGAGTYTRPSGSETWTKGGSTTAAPAAAETAGLEFVLTPDKKGYSVSKGTVTSGAVVIPATYNNLPVTEIANKAFNGTQITAVTIPDSVKTIRGSAFLDCASLTSVTIGKGVTEIEAYAFRGCAKLTSVTFSGQIATFWQTSFVTVGDIRDKYLAAGGGAGTYTRPSGGETWTKK